MALDSAVTESCSVTTPSCRRSWPSGMPCTVVTLDTVMDDTSVSATTAPVTELPSTDWMTEIWLCAHVKEQTAE